MIRTALKQIRPRLVAFLIVAASGTSLSNSSASACCTQPVNKQYPLDYLSCSSIKYDLRYQFQGVIYDDTTYTVFGACAAAYTDCTCLFHQALSYPGHINFHNPMIDKCSYNVYWDAFNVNTITWSTCTSGSCSKTGSWENPITYYEYDYIGYTGVACC